MKNEFIPANRANAERRGFSMVIGLAAGTILLLAVISYVYYSSSEMRIVKSMLNRKKADFAAYSALNVASARLMENRWYQPENNPNVAEKFKSSHSEKLVDYFKDDKSLTADLFIDEIPHPKAQKSGNENTDGSIWVKISQTKRQYRALLDHIRVLALGTSGDEKALYFGKFIMVPEPYLADNLTTGHLIDDPLMIDADEKIPIYPDAVWDNAGEEGTTEKSKKFVISVSISAGQKVKMGQVIMVLGYYMSTGEKSTREEQVVSPYSGKIASVEVSSGGDAIVGKPVAWLEKEPGDLYSPKTLRKMVQITKIPLSVFKDLKLENRDDRFKVYNYVAKTTLETVINRMPMKTISDGTTESFKSVKNETSLTGQQAIGLFNSAGTPQWGVDDIEKMFAALNAKSNQNQEPDVDVNSDYDKIYANAGKAYISNLWVSFTPPARLASSTKKDFSSMSSYKLGVQPSKVSDEMLSLLKLVSSMHGVDYLSQISTRPQENPNLYNIASTTNNKTGKGYWEEMKHKENLGAQSDNVKDYIKSMSQLRDGAKKIRVKLDQGTPWEDAPFKQMVADGTANPDDYFWWEEKQGWYKKIPKDNVQIMPVDVPYGYTNDSDPQDPFKMDTGQLLSYFRKHYTFGTTLPPPEDIWAENTVTDTPQKPGPPDSTGAKYSGLSS